MSAEPTNELIRLNNQLCRFSLDGRFLAAAYQTNLLIKNTGTFDTFRSYIFPEAIEFIEWSPDCEYILCANIKRAVIQAYSICYPEWNCKLIEGSAGLESVAWSPDSRHILTLADFNIQLSVWSLENRTATHVQNIKSSAFDRLHFSPDGGRLALIITDDGQDSVEIYKTSQWRISRKLICERLNSIDGICWSPNNELLCIWCATSDEPKLVVYSIPADRIIAVYGTTTRGNPVNSKDDYSEHLIGIESVKWAPSGQLLAVAGLNEMVVLLNYTTWNPILSLHLDPVIRQTNYPNKVYKEIVIESKHVLMEEHERPINIQIDKTEKLDRLSIAKIAILEFSRCGQYLAMKHELYPTTLWIWDVIADCLDYMIFRNTVVGLKWNPTHAHLLVFCECAHVFEWTPKKALCTPTPRGVTVLDAQWHPQGTISALCGYNKAVLWRAEELYE